MNDLLIMGLVMIIVLAGAILYPYAKRKGWIKGENISGAKNAVLIAKLMARVLQLDPKTRDRTNLILDMVDIAVDCIAELDDPNADKYALSIQTIGELLKQLEITPTADEQALIERLVSEVLALYEK